jgi:hypothetical protein
MNDIECESAIAAPLHLVPAHEEPAHTGHDDVANAVAGAAALSKFGGYDTSLRWVSGDDDDAWTARPLVGFL